MEQHPVPQNITSFQFRLIGDMTIKQFGYLAGGIILAFISYKLPLPFFFTWPMAAVFALLGFGFAFVPVEERPMDIWFFSFLKNVYNPTVFHWEHTELSPEPSKALVPPPAKIPTFKTPLVPSPHSFIQTGAPHPALAVKPPVSNLPITPKPPGKAPGTSPFDSLFLFIDNLFVTKPRASPAYVVTPQSRPNLVVRPINGGQQQKYHSSQHIPATGSPSIIGKKVEPVQEVTPQIPATQPTTSEKQKAEENLDHLKTELETVQKQLSEKNTEDKRFLELQQQLTGLMSERQKMENELIALRSKVGSTSQPQPQNFRSAGVVSSQQPNEPTIKTMTPDVATRAGLPRLTTFPNVVTGIIKDYDNNLLPGVLVTVKDKEGVPLRALKTNKLGQFAASTQLVNGTYMVEVEDPRERFLFDRVQITVNGSVMPALQIIAKSKRSLDREKLEKEIFGTPNASV
jgi:hypothetical protein